MNLIQFLESFTKNSPDRIAIIEEGEQITYRELWRNVDVLAKAFLDMGIKEGDRIAISLPNCQEYIYSFLAALKINAIAVPLKQSMTSYELKTILKDCRQSLLITEDIFLRRILPFGPFAGMGKIIVCSKHIINRGAFVQRSVKIQDLLKSTSGLGTTFPADDSTVASINYTYRGYGYPLGAMLTHGNYRWGIDAYISHAELEYNHRVIIVLPISHIYPLVGCVFSPFFIGATIVLSKRATPIATINLIDSFKVNVITAVPTFYSFLLKSSKYVKYNLSSIEQSHSGGSLLPLSVYSGVKEKFGWDVRQGYGLTECIVVTSNATGRNRPETLGEVGRNAEIRIVDTENRKVETNKVGEIIIRSKTLMQGYYNRQKETEDVLKNNWFYTGDYGYFDDAGYVFFSGLKKKIVKVGGNMVDLVEVNKFIKCFPGVIKSEVNVIDDPIWGSFLTAEVEVSEPNGLKTEQIKSFLRSRLMTYKIPRLKVIG